METNTHRFYQELPVHRMQTEQLFARPELFRDVPSDWLVFVTDITGSTQAVQQGKERDVNMAAASSIIIAHNLGIRNKMDIPAVFNGDGTLILCPPALEGMLSLGLAANRASVQQVFGLEQRVGKIPVGILRAAGLDLRVAKLHFTTDFNQPVFLGNAVLEAERWLKANLAYHLKGDGDPMFADMSGLECYWDVIAPPKGKKEVVCLIVQPLDEKKSAEVYANVLGFLNTAYGKIAERHPIRAERLRLEISLSRLWKETLMQKGNRRKWIKKIIKTILGKWYFWMNLSRSGVRAGQYKEDLIVATDVIKIDGALKTLFAGTLEQRIHLLDFLNQCEKKGDLIYGYFASPASIVTCYVRSFRKNHIHFIDGQGGGFTRASYELKTKLQGKTP